MWRRIGPGPVFVYESLIFARRKQVYAARALFVLALLAGLWIAWWNNLNEPVIGSPVGTRVGVLQALAQAGEAFFSAMAGIQLAMVLVVAPSVCAGAICHDRAQGILAQMATTDLSAAEIVLGKLFSRLVPILALIGCALPVSALAALLGGIDMQALFSLFVVSAAVAVLGCSLSLAISAQVARIQDASAAALALGICWLSAVPIWSGLARTAVVMPPPDWVYKANPFVVVYAPYSWPAYVTPLDVAAFAAGSLAISAVLAAYATVHLRRVVLPAEPARRGRIAPALTRSLPALASWFDGRAWARRFPAVRRRLDRLPAPTLDANPVLWREWHRSRPSRMMRILWGLYWILAIGTTGLGVEQALAYGLDTPSGGLVLYLSLSLQTLLGPMLLSARAPASLGEERILRSLDVLMTTPIPSRAIVWGKWLGAYRTALWLAILPGLAATILAAASPAASPRFVTPGIARPTIDALGVLDRVAIPPLVVAQLLSAGAAIVSLGLYLAVRIARPGRAIALSVAAFVLLAIGWPFFASSFIVQPLMNWLVTFGTIQQWEVRWLIQSLISFSPMVGSLMTISTLSDPRNDGVWMFHVVMFAWCGVECAFASAMYRAAVASFDRWLGRMRETSVGGPDDAPPPLVPELAGCENGDR